MCFMVQHNNNFNILLVLNIGLSSLSVNVVKVWLAEQVGGSLGAARELILAFYFKSLHDCCHCVFNSWSHGPSVSVIFNLKRRNLTN